MNIFFSKINKPYETLKSELENLDFRAGQEIYAEFMNSTLSNCKFDWFHLIQKIHKLNKFIAKYFLFYAFKWLRFLKIEGSMGTK